MIVTRGLYPPITVYGGGANCLAFPIALNELSATGNATWPANNRAIYIPLSLEDDFVLNAFGHVQGVAATGNYDIGVYDFTGTRLASLGSTGVGATGVTKIVTVTPILLPKGGYFIGYSFSSTTNQVSRMQLGTPLLNAIGVRQEANALPLPNPATFALAASDYFPYVVFLQGLYAHSA